MFQEDLVLLNNLGLQIKQSVNDQQLNDILKFIDKYLFINDEFAFNAYLQNQELIGSFRFRNSISIDIEQEFDFLRLLSKVATVYFRNDPMKYDYYVLQEIKDTLNFISTELFTNEVYRTINKSYLLKDSEYHYQLELYKYAFSLLEKIRSLLITMFDGKRNDNEYDNYQLNDQKLKKAINRIAKNKESNLKLNTLFFNQLTKTSVFNYLRKLRNKLTHDYLNPNLKKNYNLDIYLIYLLCFYTFSVVVNNIKSDDELVDVYKQVNMN